MIRPLPHKSGEPWHWNTIPDPRPVDFGVGMTICIAAHCYPSQCIICATDMMVSTGDMSADQSARKMQGIGDHWIVMFAGDEISPVTPVMRHVRRKIRIGQESLDERSEEHTSELQSQSNLVCRLLLAKKKRTP